MKNSLLEICVEDVGDRSVGLNSEVVLKAELSNNFVSQLKDDGTLKEFKNKLQRLVEEYCEPDTYYETYDSEMTEGEDLFYAMNS